MRKFIHLLRIAACCAVSALVLCAIPSCSSKQSPAVQHCVRPAFLQKGDKVAIISPSFALVDSMNLQRSCDVLRQWGLEPVVGKYVLGDVVRDSLGKRLEVYSGTPEQRAEDLKWALEDDSIKCILCSRGGYGAMQLLDLVPLKTYSDNPKWLVGFSDVTALLGASTVAGVMSLHGDMASEFGEEEGPDEYSLAMRDVLFGNIPSYHVDHNENDVEGHAEGMLVGGNMITYEVLMGTAYDCTQYDGIILLIEEVEESFHAIDRFLNTLVLQGRVPNIKGIIVGNMRKCPRDMDYDTAYDLIGEYSRKWNIPTTMGLKCGHGGHNLPVIIGSQVSIDVTSEGSDIKFLDL